MAPGMILRVQGGEGVPCAASSTQSKSAARTGEMAEAAIAVNLGPVVGCWRARRSWLVVTGLLAVAAMAVSIWRLGSVAGQLLGGAPGTDLTGLLWVMGLVVGVASTIAFAALALLRVHLHEHGLVVQSIDGVRAIAWEAIRSVQRRSGRLFGVPVEALELVLVHGEVLRIVGLEELPLLAALIESSTGARRRLRGSRD